MLAAHKAIFVIAGLAALLDPAALAEQTGRDMRPQVQVSASEGRAMLRVGEPVTGYLHPVTRPGLYGMSDAPHGSRYGIVDGKLIRYDPAGAQVLSIIRQVDRIMD